MQSVPALFGLLRSLGEGVGHWEVAERHRRLGTLLQEQLGGLPQVGQGGDPGPVWPDEDSYSPWTVWWGSRQSGESADGGPRIPADRHGRQKVRMGGLTKRSGRGRRINRSIRSGRPKRAWQIRARLRKPGHSRVAVPMHPV